MRFYTFFCNVKRILALNFWKTSYLEYCQNFDDKTFFNIRIFKQLNFSLSLCTDVRAAVRSYVITIISIEVENNTVKCSAVRC